MADDRDYRGPERRRHGEGGNGFDEYKMFLLEKLKSIDERLKGLEGEVGNMRIKLVRAGIVGAIAGAVPSLVTALFMYYSLVK